jgi:hypothetical protein
MPPESNTSPVNPSSVPLHLHKDRFNYQVKPGMRAYLSCIIMNLDPSRPDGPIVVQIGDGETPGMNVSVNGKHLALHPDEPHIPLGQARPAPITGGMLDSRVAGGRAAAVLPQSEGGEATSTDSPLTEDGGAPALPPNVTPFNPAPGAPPATPPADEPPTPTSAPGSDTVNGGIATPHTTPDNQQPANPTPLPGTGLKSPADAAPKDIQTPDGSVASTPPTSVVPPANNPPDDQQGQS